jgi:hypothetical protein
LIATPISYTMTETQRLHQKSFLNLTLTNIPTGLHPRLKAPAESNRRSLNGEILAWLESLLDAPSVDVAAEQRALEEFVAPPAA